MVYRKILQRKIFQSHSMNPLKHINLILCKYYAPSDPILYPLKILGYKGILIPWQHRPKKISPVDTYILHCLINQLHSVQITEKNKYYLKLLIRNINAIQ